MPAVRRLQRLPHVTAFGDCRIYGGLKKPLNRFKVTRHLLDEVFKKYEGLLVGAPGKSVQNLAPIQLEGGTEETLGVDYGKTFCCGRTKGTALSQIKISFTPSDDVKTEDGKVKAL